MLLFLDFETYYDREYSLKKITPAEYILDSRFETICMGAAENDDKGFIVDGPDVGKYLAGLDATCITTITYNSLFDNSILAWRYNFVPGRMVDGLGMARALLGSRLRSLSLENVAKHFGLGEKGNEIYNVIGMHRVDIIRDQNLWDRFRAYCLNDTMLLREIYLCLHREFPAEEYAIMDAVLRCCIEPKFHCDVGLLENHLKNIRMEKDRLCAAAGLHKDTVSGNASFIAALETQGVTVETKPGKRGPIPAIAKTDAFMQQLLEDERPEVQCLAAARLGVKSTIEERRSERLISIASLPWPSQTSMMPIPLRYSGAHTWRLSGDWRINMQNLPSARMGNPVLRKSLVAPIGQKVVVGDLAQIEARLVAWFCGAEGLLTEFREKRDPYARLAEQIFDMSVDKQTMGGVARHIGKAGILGCGYGMGAKRFYASVLQQSRSMLDIEQQKILKDIWTEELAAQSVAAYRKRYSAVKYQWGQLKEALEKPFIGRGGSVIGPIAIDQIGADVVVTGPGGRKIVYPRLYHEENGDIWWFDGGVPCRIYGALIFENIIQFLARIVMFDIAMRIKKCWGLCFVHQVHDELVFIVCDQAVERVRELLNNEMKTPPAWCADLPLDCEVGFSQRYGDCK